MTDSDDTEHRLRKILRGLPRAQAPGDFEAKVAGRIVRKEARGRSWVPSIRGYAISGIALLVVSALSYLTYVTQYRQGGGDIQQPADRWQRPAGSDTNQPSRPDEVGRTGTETEEILPQGRSPERMAPSGTGPTRRAEPESQLRKEKSDQATSDAVDAKLESRPGSRTGPGAIPVPMMNEKGVDDAGIRGKSVPGRESLLDEALSDTALDADSLAARDSLMPGDTLGVDSTQGSGNVQRDSTGNPRAD